MKTAKHFFCSMIFLWMVQVAQANQTLAGSIKLKSGKVEFGFVSYNKIAVPTRVLFFEKNSTTGEIIDSTKTLYSPQELEYFTYGENEKWLSISFYKKDIGFAADYFMQVLDSTQSFYLVAGMVTGEGCNCSGTKISSTYYYVIYNALDTKKIIVAKKRRAKIKNSKEIARFFKEYDIEVDPKELTKPITALSPLKE